MSTKYETTPLGSKKRTVSNKLKMIRFDRAQEVKKAELYAFENLPDMTPEQREGAMVALSILHSYADRVASGQEL